MTPRLYAAPTSGDETVPFARSRRSWGIFSIAAVALLLALITYNHATAPDRAEAEKQGLTRACKQWHLAASTVVASLVHSASDADLRRVNDSIFRMRRARRNCEAGWFELACQDYFAVASGAPSYAATPQLFPCKRVAETHDGGN